MTWRSTSYLLAIVTFGCMLLSLEYYYDFTESEAYISNIMTITAPYQISLSVPYIVQLINLVAVYWIYGSYNFINDIYISDHKAGVIYIFI